MTEAALKAVFGGLVVAQVNRCMPFTYGDAVIPVEEIDYGIEADCELAGPARHPTAELFQAIGAHVVTLVDDGATL